MTTPSTTQPTPPKEPDFYKVARSCYEEPGMGHPETKADIKHQQYLASQLKRLYNTPDALRAFIEPKLEKLGLVKKELPPHRKGGVYYDEHGQRLCVAGDIYQDVSEKIETLGRQLSEAKQSLDEALARVKELEELVEDINGTFGITEEFGTFSDEQLKMYRSGKGSGYYVHRVGIADRINKLLAPKGEPKQ